MNSNPINSISCGSRNNINSLNKSSSSERSHHHHHHHHDRQESHPRLEERPSSSSQTETQPLLAPITSTSNQNTLVNYYTLLQSTSGFGQKGENMLKFTNDKKDKNGNELKSEIDGSHAFLTLAIIFMINANTLASLKVYGIIFERIVADKYYTREEASWPVSTASTVQNLAGLLTPILAMRISWRSIELIQASLFIIANVGAYFSDALTMDIICLGIIQGVAFSIRYNMNVVINNEYFHKYRATAMGISMAGSSCGVFFLKPYVAHVLDTSGPHQFRDAYLALALIMSFNIILSLFIRKPKDSSITNESNNNNNQNTSNNIALVNPIGEDEGFDEPETVEENEGLSKLIVSLLKNPSIHCIWIMQTIYFYISRTYTIFIVDYGLDQGFSRDTSRNLLTSWVLGEIGGRFLLGGFVDYKLLNLKWNIIVVNILLAGSGFALLVEPAFFNFENNQQVSNETLALSYINNSTTTTNPQEITNDESIYFWYLSIMIAMVAALSSLLNIMIVPFSQEYLGKKNVPWAFALGSIVTSIFLLLRPVLIGMSKDSRNSYDLLIIVMSSVPCIYGIIFLITEPFLKRHRYRRRESLIPTISQAPNETMRMI